MTRLPRHLLLALALAAGGHVFAAGPAAEIVTLQGKGDYRAASASDWQPARVKQALEAGQYVRTTQAESKMGLLLADQTQMTLQGVSIVQVKSPEAAGPRRSIIEFGKGTGRFQTKTPSKEFRVGTPTGLAAIRGTEWLVEVDDDGRSAFTVVEGELDISNDLGSISVGADEQGVLERGKAPFKRRLQDSRARVQWVSAFTLDPARYPSPRIDVAAAAIRAGEISRARTVLGESLAREGGVPEAYFLLADIELYFGRGREALALLERAALRHPGDPRVPGLTARAALFADDFPRARAAAATALARFPDHLESQLAAGEVARLDGDGAGARRALRRATRIAPQDWRAWHALGQAQAERAHPRAARRALDQAHRLSPDNAQVLGEAALVEASAYDLARARSLIDRALAIAPDDFSTWTGAGVARLKSGDTAGALDALLRATLLEPRSARAHVYLGVVYWQLGRASDAFAQMRTASLNDAKDPLPWQLVAMMHADLMRPGEALEAAREALARLGYVKSLDAVANDLRGAANLGAPLVQMGLEAWALKNAHDSFDPLWAGSHLFLADRLPGKFLGNSELLQGFLSDPLAFGASNRFQSLVSRPGHYATLAMRASHSADARLVEPLANANGLLDEGRIAYFVEGTRLRSWQDDGSARDRAASLTFGAGLKPRDDVGLFLYANRLVPEARTGNGNRAFDPYQLVDGAARRIDAGVHYRPGPDWQVWIKGGNGSEEQRLQDRGIERVGFAQVIRESHFTSAPRRSDLGARATRRTAGGLECYAVVERAVWKSTDFLERDASPRLSVTAERTLESVLQEIRDASRSLALGVRWPVARAVTLEFEADRTTYDKTNAILVRRDFIGQRVETSDNHARRDWSPRAGVVVRPSPAWTLRAAWQEWLRPASTSSLKPAATAGIALDERYVLPGGRLERGRAQVEWEALPTLMVSAFADRQEINNLYSPLAGLLNNRPDSSNLERLRNRSFEALAGADELEGFPQLARGRLTESGFAVNAVAARGLSAFAEGAWATSENTADAQRGKRLAFMPRTRFAVGGTWFPGRRLSLAAKATYRSERFADEANTQRLEPGWSGALQGYWETVDKRLSVSVVVVNLGAKQADEAVGIAVNLRF